MSYERSGVTSPRGLHGNCLKVYGGCSAHISRSSTFRTQTDIGRHKLFAMRDNDSPALATIRTNWLFGEVAKLFCLLFGPEPIWARCSNHLCILELASSVDNARH